MKTRSMNPAAHEAKPRETGSFSDSGYTRAQMTILLVALLSAGFAGMPGRAEEITFAPGKTTALPWPPVSADVQVYVPEDYDETKDWPIVFNYHGLNGQPTTAPVQSLMQGKGCIIVGMEYLERGLKRRTAEENETYQRNELRQFEQLKASLQDRLMIDRKRIFISGTSKGGWQVSSLLERGIPGIAGAIILIAGRFPSHALPEPRLEDLPVYIGAGETDPNNPYTRMADQYFGHCGAKVTYEEYAGLGHAVDPEAPALRGWLDLHLNPDRDGARARAREWLKEQKQRFDTESDAGKQYTVLAAIAANPWLHLCGSASREAVRRQLDTIRQSSPVREEYEAELMYEKALWQEQAATSLRKLERSLEIYRKVIEKYPDTRYGTLAVRDADRVQGFVDEAHARSRSKAPQIPRIRVR